MIIHFICWSKRDKQSPKKKNKKKNRERNSNDVDSKTANDNNNKKSNADNYDQDSAAKKEKVIVDSKHSLQSISDSRHLRSFSSSFFVWFNG